MRPRVTPVLGSLIILAIAGALPPATASAQRAVVARSGNDQSIKIGRNVVARPFGADLVDRLVLVGSYRIGGRMTHLVRGDAGGQCPSRYVFVTERAGAAPVISTPFGSCQGNARVRASTGLLTVTMASAADPAVTQRFAFDGATVRALDVVAQAAPECPVAAHVDPALQTATTAAFANEFPLEYRSRRALNRMAIDPLELRSVVTTLACFSTWPGADRTVTKLATPLFTSDHARAAFATLTAIAEDPSSNANLRASTRSFAAEMNFAVGRRQAVSWPGTLGG